MKDWQPWALLAALIILVIMLSKKAIATFDSNADTIAQESQASGVPQEWIKAVILTESSGDPMAYRYEPSINDASYGLMQLLYRTATGLGYSGQREGLFDPAVNIHYGTALLQQLRARYGDDIKRVYSAYNSGRPDTYLTNTQVAANVNRLLVNLAQVSV